jgi:putative lipoic acid-binding regulatory protein
MTDNHDSKAETPSLIEFPCSFVIKVMGEADDHFVDQIVILIQTHVPSFTAQNIEIRNSAAGKYASLSCNVWTTSQAHLDGIYQSLTASPLVKFTL